MLQEVKAVRGGDEGSPKLKEFLSNLEANVKEGGLLEGWSLNFGDGRRYQSTSDLFDELEAEVIDAAIPVYGLQPGEAQPKKML